MGMTAHLFMESGLLRFTDFDRIHGYLPSSIYDSKIKMGGGSLDYLLNMSSLAYGYNATRCFELVGIAGIEASYSKWVTIAIVPKSIRI